jgi:uncharacterized membrane protein YkvA (DUF1232 family)
MSWWGWLLISLGVVVAVWAAFVVWLVAAGRRDDARAFATFIPDCIVLVTRLTRDSRVPRRRKLLLLGLLGYLALPFDLVPDFIPVAGQLDDALVVAFVLRHFVRAGGEPLIRELWPGPGRSLDLVLQRRGMLAAPFEGRAEDMDELERLLVEDRRAVIVEADGGYGKTRLAFELARSGRSATQWFFVDRGLAFDLGIPRRD